MPLRPAYVNLVRKPHDGIRILVTTGATDSLDVLGNFLSAFLEKGLNSRAEVYAIVGRYNHNREALRKRFGQIRAIHLLDPQPDLAELIASCDIAVTAGGTTVYELCAGGIPSVMLTIADNQRMAAEDEILRYLEDPKQRAAASDRLRTVVDGGGADRIAERLLSMK